MRLPFTGFALLLLADQSLSCRSTDPRPLEAARAWSASECFASADYYATAPERAEADDRGASRASDRRLRAAWWAVEARPIPPARWVVANLTAAMLTRRHDDQVEPRDRRSGSHFLESASTRRATGIASTRQAPHADVAARQRAGAVRGCSAPAVLSAQRVRANQERTRLTDASPAQGSGRPAIANHCLCGDSCTESRIRTAAQLLGTEESVAGAFAPSDLQAFYQSNFIPNNATLIIVGDVTPGADRGKDRSVFRRMAAGNCSDRSRTASRPKPGNHGDLPDRQARRRAVVVPHRHQSEFRDRRRTTSRSVC